MPKCTQAIPCSREATRSGERPWRQPLPSNLQVPCLFFKWPLDNHVAYCVLGPGLKFFSALSHHIMRSFLLLGLIFSLSGQFLITQHPDIIYWKPKCKRGNWFRKLGKRGSFFLAFPVPPYFKLAAVSLYVSKSSSPGTISWRPRRCHMHFLSLLWLICQEAGRVIGKGAGLTPGTPRAAVRARLPHKFEQEVRRAVGMSHNNTQHFQQRYLKSTPKQFSITWQ